MPSYRVRLTIGRLHPGVSPERLLPAAAAAAAETATVEAKDVGIVAGRPEITVRFTAPDDREAHGIAARVHHRAEDLAQVSGPAVARRRGARWEPV
ncbi:MAG: hypothetical protein ACYC1Z_03105 [Georgenia sp.]